MLPPMTERDQFIQAQVQGMLQPGEQIRGMAFVQRTPSIIVMMLCYWAYFFMTTSYYAALTDRRILLIVQRDSIQFSILVARDDALLVVYTQRDPRALVVFRDVIDEVHLEAGQGLKAACGSLGGEPTRRTQHENAQDTENVDLLLHGESQTT